MNTFEQFQNRLLIQATLEMETALSVGSRASLEPTGTDLPVIKAPDGIPFIPGSSIKGVVRSQMERVLRAVNRKPDFWACDPFGDPCVSSDEKENFLREVEDLAENQRESAFTQKVWEKSCTVCRLFGSPWLASRLFFKDARLGNPTALPVTTQIRDGVGIDRDLGAARHGVKYDFEVVVPGACFNIEILAENAEDWEMGLLLAVLRPWEEGHLPIGGKSTRGPGWGKLKNLTVQRVDRSTLLDYLVQGKTVPVESQTFMDAFQEKIKGRKEAGHA